MKFSTTCCAAVVIAASLLLPAVPARAHHAMVAQFALDKPITLRGTVTKMMWRNPHGLIFMDVKQVDGQVVSWRVETGSMPHMIKLGLKKTDFMPGLEIIVGGYPAKDGQYKAAGVVVTFPDRELRAQEASFSLGRRKALPRRSRKGTGGHGSSSVLGFTTVFSVVELLSLAVCLHQP